MKQRDSAEERTRTGNTPTCEDCGKPMDNCECEEDDHCDECEGNGYHKEGCLTGHSMPTVNLTSKLIDPASDEALALLDAAKTAQTAYWDAVKALEDALGIEIDSTDDLQTFSDCSDLIDQNTI